MGQSSAADDALAWACVELTFKNLLLRDATRLRGGVTDVLTVGADVFDDLASVLQRSAEQRRPGPDRDRLAAAISRARVRAEVARGRRDAIAALPIDMPRPHMV